MSSSSPSLIPRTNAFALSLAAAFGIFLGFSFGLNAMAAPPDFHCMSAADGVLKANSAQIMCPGSNKPQVFNAGARSADEGGGRQMCTYTAFCYNITASFKLDIAKMATNGNPGNVNIDTFYATLPASQISLMAAQAYSAQKQMMFQNPNLEHKLYVFHEKKVDAVIQCLSDTAGKCPAIDECMKLKEGGIFTWEMPPVEPPINAPGGRSTTFGVEKKYNTNPAFRPAAQ